MTRNGKIARLPREIRELLNTKIENGQIGTELVDWLNSEPEVRQVLQEHFNGRPISEQNLSEWKNGGYVEWQARQEIFDQARELDADGADLGKATGGRLTDHLATVLAARYAAVLSTWNGQISEEFENTLRILHSLCRHIAILRRGEHNSARLAMEQERLGGSSASQGRTKPEPESKMTEEEREEAINEILGLAPDGTPLESLKPNQSESKQGTKATDEHRFAQMKCKVEGQGGQSEEIRPNQSGSNQEPSSNLNTSSPPALSSRGGEGVSRFGVGQSEQIRLNQGESNQEEPLSLTLSPLGQGEGTKSEEIRPNQTNLRISEPVPPSLKSYGGQGIPERGAEGPQSNSEQIKLNQSRSKEEEEELLEELLREHGEAWLRLQTLKLQYPETARKAGIT